MFEAIKHKNKLILSNKLFTFDNMDFKYLDLNNNSLVILIF
jgi:hypothetical protein